MSKKEATKPKKQREKKVKETKVIFPKENKTSVMIGESANEVLNDNNKLSLKELQKKAQPLPVLTVAMPLYDMGKIAWLALESLCNQKEINFKWELLIIEEKTENSIKNINEYRDRLDKVGCIRIEFISLDEWIPLGEKWRILADFAATSSKCLLLQAGDCYSHNTRLADTLKQFEKNPELDFYDERFVLFYHLYKKKMVVYDVDSQRVSNTGMNMAWRTELIKQLPENTIRKNVDNFLFTTLSKIKGSILVRVRRSEIQPSGFDSHGLNKISSSRGQMFETEIPPIGSGFYPTKYRLNSNAKGFENIDIPVDVKERILKIL